METSLTDKVKSSISKIKDTVTNFTEDFWDDDKKEIVNMFKEGGENKVTELLSNLNSYKNLFKKAGYLLGGINMSAALPPDVSLTFKCLKTTNDAEREGYLTEAEKNKLILIILKSLFRASDFSERVKIGEFKLQVINIKLGLIPGINVSFA